MVTLNFSLVEPDREIPMANNGAILSQSDIDRALMYLRKGKTDLFAHVLETAAFNRVFNICQDKGLTWEDPWWDGEDMIPEYLPKGLTINLYITDSTFTPALIAVINMCQYNCITLNTWHYNKDNGNYFSYPVT